MCVISEHKVGELPHNHIGYEHPHSCFQFLNRRLTFHPCSHIASMHWGDWNVSRLYSSSLLISSQGAWDKARLFWQPGIKLDYLRQSGIKPDYLRQPGIKPDHL